MESDKVIQIFSGTIWQAEMVRSLLENAGIRSFLKDEIVGSIAPWYAAPGGAGSVKVFISDSDFQNAKIVVAEYERNLKE